MPAFLFDEKDFQEVITLTFDFTADLAAGETINTPTTEASVQSGVDAAPAAILGAAPQLSGLKVLQQVVAGVVGVNYYVRVKVLTSAGRTLVQGGVLPVRKAGLA